VAEPLVTRSVAEAPEAEKNNKKTVGLNLHFVCQWLCDGTNELHSLFFNSHFGAASHYYTK